MNELISSRATLLESSREHVASLQRVCERSNERCDRSKLTEPRRAYELTSSQGAKVDFSSETLVL